MNIHQLSLSYLNEQDRILVRINSADAQEIRLWFTRRLCLSWVPVLRSALDARTTNSGANARTAWREKNVPAWVGEFERLQHLKDADFSTPFKGDAQSWPLGSEPLLVTTVSIAPGSDGGMEMRFEECLPSSQRQERSFQAELAPKLVHGFMHLLEQALGTSQWEQTEALASVHLHSPEMEDYCPRQTQAYLH